MTSETYKDNTAHHRVHHSYIWLGGIRAVPIMLIAFIFGTFPLLYEEEIYEVIPPFLASALGIGFVIILAFIATMIIYALIVLFNAIGYQFLWYEVGTEEFTLCSGVISKRRVHVPYQRIQSIDQSANLVQRIFGICDLSIDTAGGVSNKAIIVPCLTKSDAENLRRELYERKSYIVSFAQDSQSTTQAAQNPQGGVQAAQYTQGVSQAAQSYPPPVSQPVVPPATQKGNVLDVGDEIWDSLGGVFAGHSDFDTPVTYEYGLSNKELFFAGLSNNTGMAALILGALAAASQILSAAFDLFPDNMDSAIDAGTTFAESVDPALLASGIVAIVSLFVIFIWVISAVGSLLSYGGFHARRRGDRIEVERGLLQHQVQSISIERIQSVNIKQTFIRRLIGYCEITLGKVDAADQGSSQSNSKSIQSQGAVVVHPFLKIDQARQIVANLTPEISDFPTESIPLPKRSLRRAITRRGFFQGAGFWFLVLTLVFQVILSFMQANDVSVTDGIGNDAFVYATIEQVVLIVICLCIFWIVVDIIGAILWFKKSSFGVNRKFMTITEGGYSIATVLFARSKIQSGYIKTNPLQRMSKVSTISARTAAGVGGTSIGLKDVSEDAAIQWLEWLKPASHK